MTRAPILAGIGTSLPETVLSNTDLCALWHDTNPEWIQSRTGVEYRHVLAPGEATSDLAVQAGRRALDCSGHDQVDAVVVATNTPDQPCPAIAPDVAARLGQTTIPAFDVGAVCAGFLYALANAAGLIANDIANRVLVIGADAYSTILDSADHSTRAIFGDGAGAVVLKGGAPTEPGALEGWNLGSDGTGRTLIQVPGGGSRQRSHQPASVEDNFLRMDGAAAFTQAVHRMSETAQRTADAMSWPLDQVDRWVLHQANARILTAVSRKLEQPAERFISNIALVGNTVAASIPLAMEAGMRSRTLNPGHRVILAGFGGGLAWGSVALTWPELSWTHPTTPRSGE